MSAAALATAGDASSPDAARVELRAGYREREAVRLLVAQRSPGSLSHARFADIGSFLSAGDVLVVNVSATVPAAVDAESAHLGPVRVHFSSPVTPGLWTVEPRRPSGVGSQPWLEFPGGELRLAGGASARLLTRAHHSPRLWLAEVSALGDVAGYLQRHGQPIRYAHEQTARPLSEYQTVYAAVPGSAEMPSAGRPFTTALITALVAAGVVIAPLVLHAGVASFEAGEAPDAERYHVPETTAALVNLARASGGRVVAVGTTSARALETVSDTQGVVHPGSGVTELLIGKGRGVAVVDGIVTGWHDAGSSHRELLSAVAGRGLLERAYQEAARQGYLAHEFGDSLLILGRGREPEAGAWRLPT